MGLVGLWLGWQGLLIAGGRCGVSQEHGDAGQAAIPQGMQPVHRLVVRWFGELWRGQAAGGGRSNSQECGAAGQAGAPQGR